MSRREAPHPERGRRSQPFLRVGHALRRLMTSFSLLVVPPSAASATNSRPRSRPRLARRFSIVRPAYFLLALCCAHCVN
jgi:hypothetical protein